MRKRVVLAILFGMFVVMIVIVAGRLGDGIPALATDPKDEAADAGTDAGDWVAGDVAEFAEESDLGNVEPEALGRSIRVIGKGWELLAPGVVANAGVEAASKNAFAEVGLTVELSVANSADDIREALALGGEADGGADIAIMSLPAFVADYEKLRALRPTVFYFAGWSRGYEAVAANNSNAFTSLSSPKSARLRGVPGDPATYFSLLMMHLAGIPASGVEIVADAPDAEDLSFAAVSRAGGDLDDVPKGYERLITTADAPRSIMYVAVSPAGFLQRYPDEIQKWARVWSDGRQNLRDDVPAVARMIAKHDKKQKAYELIERLGALELASVRENARAFGLAGRAPMALEDHFQLSWRIWRDAGVLSTPAPQAVPISTQTIIGLARAEAAPGPAGNGEREWSKARPIIIHQIRGDHHDEDRVVSQVGLIAGIFDRSALQLSIGDHEDLAAKVADEASARYDLARDRISTAANKHNRDRATVQVFAVD